MTTELSKNNMPQDPQPQTAKLKSKPAKPPMAGVKKMRLTAGVWIGSAVMIMGISIGLVIVPSQRTLAQQRETIQKSQTEFAEQEAATKNLISAHQRSEEITAALTELDSYFIPRNNPLPAIDRLEQIAQDQGLNVQITLPEIEGEGDIFVLPVQLTLTLTGELTPIIQFINTAIQEPMFIQFDQVNFNQQETTGEQVPIRADIIITTFWK